MDRDNAGMVAISSRDQSVLIFADGTGASMAIGDEFAKERASEKKGEAAAAMEQAFAENAIEATGFDKAIAARSSRWLPKGMVFEEADFVDEMIDEETPFDDCDAEGTDLPAFMADDAA